MKMSDDSEPSQLKIIADSELTEIATDTSEIVLDGLLDDGVLKDIPVFGWAVKVFKAQRSIRDRLFLKKVALFARGTERVSEEKREEFKKKIEEDHEHRKKVGESLILFLERHERLEKSLMLGKLFAAYLNKDISYRDFSRLAAALDRAVLEDLEALHNNASHLQMLRSQVEEGLYRCGLMRIEIEVSGEGHEILSGRYSDQKEGRVNYKLNEYGWLFLKHATS